MTSKIYPKVVSLLVTLQNAIHTQTSVDEIIVLLLYIVETRGQKVGLLRFSALKLFLQLVQSSFADVNLMNARLGFAWAVAVVI